jgi:hypothetical protein
LGGVSAGGCWVGEEVGVCGRLLTGDVGCWMLVFLQDWNCHLLALELVTSITEGLD